VARDIVFHKRQATRARGRWRQNAGIPSTKLRPRFCDTAPIAGGARSGCLLGLNLFAQTRSRTSELQERIAKKAAAGRSGLGSLRQSEGGRAAILERDTDIGPTIPLFFRGELRPNRARCYLVGRSPGLEQGPPEKKNGPWARRAGRPGGNNGGRKRAFDGHG